MKPLYIFKRTYEETRDMDDLEVADTIVLGYVIMNDKVEWSDDYTSIRRGYVYPMNKNAACYLSEMRVYPTTWYRRYMIAGEMHRIMLAVLLYNKFLGERGDIVSLIEYIKQECKKNNIDYYGR